MGNLSGLVKADENNNIYVTLFDGEVITVHNHRVPNVPHLPVIIGYEQDNRSLLQVLRSRNVFSQPLTADVPEHAKANHEWPGIDTLWVRGEQIIPGLVIPSTGLSVQIFGFVYYLDGFHVLPTQEIDLSASVPATGALFTLVEVDSAGAITLNDGSAAASRETLIYDDIPLPTANKKPLFAVKMYMGQTGILKSRLDTDIIDLRWADGWENGVDYIDGWADIEALTSATIGQIAYATDIKRFGEYDGTHWRWEGVWVQATAPANPFQGMLWMDTSGDVEIGLLFQTSENSMYLGVI